MTHLTKAIAVFGVVTALGAAGLPISSHAATTATTDISVSIAETLSITSTAGEVSGTLTNGGEITELRPTSGDAGFNVVTNRSSGYTVSIKGSGSCSGTGIDASALCNNTDDIIPAGVVAKGTSAWSYKGGNKSSYTAITAAGETIFSADGPTTDAGTTTKVQYFATASSSQAAGTYVGQATYTVASK